MKKVYLSLILCFFCFAGFSATWYSQDSAGVGDASNLNHWWSGADSTGTHPTTFATSGDLWIMQTNMMCSTSLSIGGSLSIHNGVYFTGPAGTFSIGGNLTLLGRAAFDAADELELDITGNLSVLDSSIILNNPDYTTIVFNNTLSTIGSPQTITWTSIDTSDWAQITVNSGCVVQLLSNVTLPMNPDAPDIINGTLICGTYVMNCNTNDYSFQLHNGATLITANAGGVDGSIIDSGGYSYSSSANYVFNGVAGQVTGSLMPSFISGSGSVTSNNTVGVALSQNTEFGNGSTLALSGGRLIAGDFNVTLDIDNSLTGTFSSTNMIVANGAGLVQKDFEEEGTFLFPIGDNAGNYSPLNIDIIGGSYSGAYMAVNVTNHKHPNNANIGDYLNRFWTILTSDLLHYSITGATYVPGDVVGTEANISMGQYAGSLPWTKYGPTDAGTHTLSSTEVSITSSDYTGISTAHPTMTVTPNSAICYGSTITLSVLSVASDTPFTYTWSPSTALSATTGSSVMANPTSGPITYTVVVTDGNGFMDTATTTVSVNPLPQVYDVTGGGNYCAHSGGRHVILDGSDSGIRYQLILNDTVAIGAPLAGIDSALDFGLDTLEGSYTVVATDTLTGCSDTMDGPVVITIIPTVTPSVTITPSIVDTICQGTPVDFTAIPVNGGGEPQFQWTVNDTVVGGGSPFYGYTPRNGDVVKIRLISSATCPLPDTVYGSLTMSVTSPRTPRVNLTVSPGSVVCQGTSVTITANPTFGGTAPTYLWIMSSTPVGTDSAYTFTPSDGDAVYCIMESNYFCRDSTTAYSNVIDMSVVAPVIPSVEIVALNGTTVGRNVADTFIAVVSNGGPSPSYQWYRNGTAIAGATTLVYVRPSFNNNDSISVIVTRHDACAMATFNSVHITVTTVEVAQFSSGLSEIKLLPNPNKGTFTIKGTLGTTADQEVSVQITDVLGQVIYNNKSTVQNGNLDQQIQMNSALPNGTYLLNLRSESGNNTFRFVVEQ